MNPFEPWFGVEAGTLAPAFELPDLEGRIRALSEWRGRRVLLIFVQPDCPHSRALLPVIAGILADPGGEAPVPVVVTFGQEPENRRMEETYALRCPVLLQDDMEVASMFKVRGTPAAYLVDERGYTTTVCAIGGASILRLAGLMPGPEWQFRTTEYKPAGYWLYNHTDIPGELQSLERELRLPGHDPHTLSGGDPPLVSAILATRDRPGFLPLALECYARQTYPRRELIVVDSGSEFPVDERNLQAFGARVIRVPEGVPLGAKLNIGVDAARGVLCQKWDDDDFYGPEFLQTLVSAYLTVQQRGPAVAFCIRARWFDVARWRVLDWSRTDAAGGTLHFAREDWKRHPFREIRRCEDFWFLVDQVRSGARIAPINAENLYLYVRHDMQRGERSHAWQHWLDGQPMEDYLRGLKSKSYKPERVVPDWALTIFRDVRAQSSQNKPYLQSASSVLRLGRKRGGSGPPDAGAHVDGAPTLLFQTPVIPAATGGGVAMRAGMILQALARHYRVYLMVIPLWDEPDSRMTQAIAQLCRDWTIVRSIPENDGSIPPAAGGNGYAHANSDSASAPALWHQPTPETVREMSQRFSRVRFDLVHTFRLWLCPFAEPFLTPRRGQRPQWRLDLDHLESVAGRGRASQLRAIGDERRAAWEEREALQYETIETNLLPRPDRVYVSSALDVGTLETRYKCRDVQVLPNVVQIPPAPPPRSRSEVFTFLFVGRLDYVPNVDALVFLAGEIVPLLRASAAGPFRIVVVGSGPMSTRVHTIGRLPEIDLVCAVPDVTPWYHQAHAVVVPLRTGAGTRIKVMEAMSYRRPIVSTTIGMEGLELHDGEHVLVGDTAEEFANACRQLMEDARLAERLADNAFELCTSKYGFSALSSALGTEPPARFLAPSK